jgi:hypothetical protein
MPESELREGTALEHSVARGRAHRRIDLFCPFPSGMNRYAEEVQARSIEWTRQFALVAEEAELERLGRSKISWLSACVFRRATPEALQVIADWTTLFCLLDDRTELAGLTLVELSAYLSHLLTAFREGTRPVPSQRRSRSRRHSSTCASGFSRWVRPSGCASSGRGSRSCSPAIYGRRSTAGRR